MTLQAEGQSRVTKKLALKEQQLAKTQGVKMMNFGWIETDEFGLKMMNFVSKMMDFALKID